MTRLPRVVPGLSTIINFLNLFLNWRNLFVYWSNCSIPRGSYAGFGPLRGRQLSRHGRLKPRIGPDQAGPDGLREQYKLQFLDFILISNGLLLPGGVIGNTGAFGASIPGSSPGRVDVPKPKCLDKL